MKFLNLYSYTRKKEKSSLLWQTVSPHVLREERAFCTDKMRLDRIGAFPYQRGYRGPVDPGDHRRNRFFNRSYS